MQFSFYTTSFRYNSILKVVHVMSYVHVLSENANRIAFKIPSILEVSPCHLLRTETVTNNRSLGASIEFKFYDCVCVRKYSASSDLRQGSHGDLTLVAGGPRTMGTAISSVLQYAASFVVKITRFIQSTWEQKHLPVLNSA